MLGRIGLRSRWITVLALLTVLPAILPAQQDVDESRRRLEEVRRERERLELKRVRLQGQVHDLGKELDNLERQRQTTGRIVNELEGPNHATRRHEPKNGDHSQAQPREPGVDRKLGTIRVNRVLEQHV